MAAHLAEAGAALLRTLEGLGDGAVIQICADAADAHTPLVQALASENARRATVLDERASWRHNVSRAHPTTFCAPYVFVTQSLACDLDLSEVQLCLFL